MSYIEKVDFSWKQLPNNSKKIPSVRCNMSGGMYDGNLWLLMGAGAGSGRSSDVWKFDIKKCDWSIATCSGDVPSPRDGHSATYVGAGKFLSFGGQGTPTANSKAFRSGDQASKTRTLCAREVFNELHEFDCETMTWTAIHTSGGPPPTSRRLHSANYISYQQSQGASAIEDKSMMSAVHSLANKSGTFGASVNTPRGHKSTLGAPSSDSKRFSNNVSTPAASKCVPNDSLLIYGGCGIEPSKKSEQVYNDLWAYVRETGVWVQMQSRGAIPRPQSGHKSELIGDILIVVGGIAATPFTLSKSDQVLSASLSSITSDVMTLNIKNLTWSYLDLRDSMGRTVKLNLHGHTIAVDHSNTNNTDILVFGGKDALDTKEFDAKRAAATSTRHFCRLNIHTGTVLPINSRDRPPENRYGHIAVSLDTDPPVEDPLRGGRMSSSSTRSEPIMLIYGGSSLEAGGFLEPEVFAFVRTSRFEATDDQSQHTKSPKGTGDFQRSTDSFGTGGLSARRSGASRRSFDSVRSSNRSQKERAALILEVNDFPEYSDDVLEMEEFKNGNNNYNSGNMSNKSNRSNKSNNYNNHNNHNNHNNGTNHNNGINGINGDYDGGNGRKTIWQRMYDKGPQNGGIAVSTARQPSESWADLKLSLSYPTTDRDSVIKIVPPIIYPSSLKNGGNGSNKGKGKGKNGRFDVDGIPDAIRIGKNLDLEIQSIENNMKKYKSSRESRSAKLLLGENPHNLLNSQAFRKENGLNPTFKMLQTLGTGQGTKSMLHLENEDLRMKAVTFKKLGLQNSQSEMLISAELAKIRENKIKMLSKKLLPLVRGMKKSAAKERYLEEYPLSEVDDWNKQTTIMLKQALSLNLSLNY